jgi:hypothetical protein
MANISDEWIHKFQEISKKNDGIELSREETIEELERIVRFCELLIEVGERNNWKIPQK